MPHPTWSTSAGPGRSDAYRRQPHLGGAGGEQTAAVGTLVRLVPLQQVGERIATAAPDQVRLRVKHDASMRAAAVMLGRPMSPTRCWRGTPSDTSGPVIPQRRVR